MRLSHSWLAEFGLAGPTHFIDEKEIWVKETEENRVPRSWHRLVTHIDTTDNCNELTLKCENQIDIAIEMSFGHPTCWNKFVIVR